MLRRAFILNFALKFYYFWCTSLFITRNINVATGNFATFPFPPTRFRMVEIGKLFSGVACIERISVKNLFLVFINSNENVILPVSFYINNIYIYIQSLYYNQNFETISIIPYRISILLNNW